MKRLWLTLLLSIVAMSLSASHIIGGYMSYRHLGLNFYEITLTVYRDCYYGGPQFDDPAYVGIYRSNGALYRNLSIANPKITKLNPSLQDPCVIVPKTICVEEGIYKDTLYLPPSFNGYDLVYQRCCRNGTIVNLQVPSQTGATYTAHIPGPNEVQGGNSSPRFNQFPPITICVGDPLQIDQSAFDLDGDSLSFSLCTPLNGAQFSQAQPNPPPPPPFAAVNYANGYNAAYPLDGSPGLQIHPVTGQLTGLPTLQGQFVVGICVTEYRKGQVIGSYLRDFQFNVIQCQKMAAIAPVIDTLYCEPYTVSFTNLSTNATQYLWDFGDPTTTQDQSALFEPSYTYPDTGQYQVRLIAKNNKGCVDTAYTTVTIRVGAKANFLFSPPCRHPDLVFTDLSQAYKGSIQSWYWDFGDGSTSTQQFPRHAFAQAGYYPVALTITTDSGCTASFTKDVLFKPAPDAYILATDGCVGDAVAFQDSSISPASPIVYRKWRINGQTSINTTSLSRTYTQPGTYPANLLVINAIGCQDSITHWVNVHANPAIEITGDTLICEGQATTLQASGAHQYNWSVQNSSLPTITVSPKQTATYSVVGTDTNGCQSSAKHTVQVAPPLTLTTQQDGPVCSGDTITLTASTSGQVDWWEQGQIIGQGKTITKRLSGHTQVIATATSPLGCKIEDTIDLATYPTPSLQVTPTKTTICAGQTVALLASGGSQYQWEPATDLSCTNCPNPLVTPTASRQYTVTVSNQYQCTAIDSVPIVFYPKTNIGLHYDSALCHGDTARLSLTAVQNVVWRPNTAISCDTCLSTKAVLPNTSLLKAHYTDRNGCPGDTTFSITVYPSPTLQLQPANPYVCVGDSVTLQVTGAQQLQWQPHPSLSCFTCPNPVASPLIDTYYEINGTNSFGCETDTVWPIRVKSLPEPALMNDTTICPGDSVKLVSQAGQNWDWTTNHQALRCPSCQSTWVKPSIPIQVQVNVTDQWGCKGQDSVFIGLLPPPDLQLSAPDSLCPGDTAYIKYNPDLLSIALLPARNLTLVEKGLLLLIPEQTTTYTFRGLGQNSCKAVQRFTLAQAPLPNVDAGPDLSVYPYQPVQLQGQSEGTFAWLPSDSLDNPYVLNPTVQVGRSQWFTLRSRSLFGCWAEDEVFVEVTPLPSLHMPNAFSPNEDGYNDIFLVELPGDYQLEIFQVFDRWGQLIHESHTAVQWDGRFQQQIISSGVYMYRLVYGTPYGFPRERKGNITLLR